ncbi:hypothetical protein, partial [Streptomyces sp. SID5789]|uniref:hypothetical protein n=1 Tax=Streptomyces sp. SID5789 TaxID=2690310 RepID=UPI0013809CB1
MTAVTDQDPTEHTDHTTQEADRTGQSGDTEPGDGRDPGGATEPETTRADGAEGASEEPAR